jgi:hypothetical protein
MHWSDCWRREGFDKENESTVDCGQRATVSRGVHSLLCYRKKVPTKYIPPGMQSTLKDFVKFVYHINSHALGTDL